MIHDALFALWILLPAAVANVVPILSAVMPGLKRWDAPLDCGLRFRGKELLGTHKTWRGIITGVLAAWFTFWLQRLGARHIDWLGSFANKDIHFVGLPLLFGLLLGVGALAGDAVKSFAKRQAGVPSGHAWIPFDQLDYIIGAMLASLPFIVLSPSVYVWIFVLWFGMHLLFSYLGWKWGLKERPI